MANKRRWSAALCVVVLMALSPGLLGAASGPGVWTKHAENPVFQPGASGAWDGANVYDPAVLYDGEIYRMWYTGNPPGASVDRIGYATSADGLSWTRGSVAPVLPAGAWSTWDSGRVWGADVLYDDGDGLYKMWYTGQAASARESIGYATSPDGIVWTRHAGNPVLESGAPGEWDAGTVQDPSVIKDGDLYKMWYDGWTAGVGGIGYATSPDGVTWTKYAGNPVMTGSPAPGWDYHVYASAVILDGGVYRMLYSGGDQARSAWETGYATSTDGTHWTRRGRVVAQGPEHAWDCCEADYADLLRVGDTYKAWYSGYRTGYQIGLSTAPWQDLNRALYLPLALRN